MNAQLQSILVGTGNFLHQVQGELAKAASERRVLVEQLEEARRLNREYEVERQQAKIASDASLDEVKAVVELAKQAGIIEPQQESFFISRMSGDSSAVLTLLKCAMVRSKPHSCGAPISKSTDTRVGAGNKDAAAGRRHV